MVTYTRDDLDRMATERASDPQRQKAFSDKLAYWRSNGFLQMNCDSVDPFVSHADGKTYDSKSEYRKNLKKQGFAEVGDAQRTESKRNEREHDEQIIRDLKRTMGEL